MSQNTIIQDNEQNEVLTVFSYNGVSFDFDIEDIEDLQRYENAYEQMTVDQKLLKKDGKKSEYVKAYCEMIRRLFENIFGDGAGTKICGERYNSRTDTEAYNAFLAFVAKQTDAGMVQKSALAATYLNRAQRRAAAKNAGK